MFGDRRGKEVYLAGVLGAHKRYQVHSAFFKLYHKKCKLLVEKNYEINKT